MCHPEGGSGGLRFSGQPPERLTTATHDDHLRRIAPRARATMLVEGRRRGSGRSGWAKGIGGGWFAGGGRGCRTLLSMDNTSLTRGGFTLPGEAGYEKLTLELAERWGADVIRDSDGTQLSDEITESGYEIYSTVCLVRGQNEWAKANRDKLQQCCMMSKPVVAEGETVEVELLAGYFREQFEVNATDDPKQWWQVFDRTSGDEVAAADWDFDADRGVVTIRGTKRWHAYTVNFFSWRIWEEISMYNHVTNDWGDREHELPIDPIYPEARAQILTFLEGWLEGHPHTRVVRLTSMFYNFWWFWGDSAERRFLVNDWGSYEFTVSPEAIRQFEKAKGYRPTSEDFVNGGVYNNSYKVPSAFYRDWMDFINAFVVDFGRQCIELIHKHGKQAFVFYNDHWVGVEPYGERFGEMGFDGIIDGIFNGFEARKVAETPAVSVRELRMHPYLFPTGVNGAPSFLPGGTPTLECKTYWADIRRALLRKKVDRIGFGGYLHLVENHPDFIEYIEHLCGEFRMLRNLHLEDSPWTSGVRVALLTAWGKMRAWACRGHFNRGNAYNEVMESVSGLPVEVEFLSFEEVLEGGVPEGVDVVINAGAAGDAWSGGRYWGDARVIEAMSSYVAGGGGLIGVGEPSAYGHGMGFFKLARVLGVERERGLTRAFDRLGFEATGGHYLLEEAGAEMDCGKLVDDVYLVDGATEVLRAEGDSPVVTARGFGSGRSVYLAGHRFDGGNARMLLRAIYWCARKEGLIDRWVCADVDVDCAFFEKARKLVVVNRRDEAVRTAVRRPEGAVEVELEAFGCKVVEVG